VAKTRPSARQHLQELMRDHLMVAGSLVEQYVTCGKSACRCASGEKHGPVYYLYWKEDGRSRSMYVPLGEVNVLRKQIETYRRAQVVLQAGAERQRRAWQHRLRKRRP
jgi:hypothetical protein